MARRLGLEPRIAILEIAVLPITLPPYNNVSTHIHLLLWKRRLVSAVECSAFNSYLLYVIIPKVIKIFDNKQVFYI